MTRGWRKSSLTLLALFAAALSVAVFAGALARAFEEGFLSGRALDAALGGSIHILALTLLAFVPRSHPSASEREKEDGAWTVIFYLLAAAALWAARGPAGELAAGPVGWAGLAALALLPIPRVHRRWPVPGIAAAGAAAMLGATVLLPALGVETAEAAEAAALTALLAVLLAELWVKASRKGNRNGNRLRGAEAAFLALGAAGALVGGLVCGKLGFLFFRCGVLGGVVCALVRLSCGGSRAREDLAIREENYRTAAKHSGQFVMRYEVRARVIRYMPETADELNLPERMENVPESLVERGMIDADTIEPFRGMFARIHAGEASGSCVFGCCGRDGGPVWLQAEFTTFFDAGGKPDHSVITCHELPGMREREAAYEECRRYYQELDGGSCVYYEANLTRGVVLGEDGALLPRIPGGLPAAVSAVTDQVARAWISPKDRAAFCKLLDPARLLRCYAQELRREAIECRRLDNGRALWTRVSVQMIADPYSDDVRAFILLADIEEEKLREAREKKRSMTDELTGLLSRTSFTEQFDELRRLSREDARHAVVMIDLDGFKAVNDTYGHHFGDEVLTDVADDLRAVTRADDLIGRLGGDEYVICLKNIPGDDAFLDRKCHAICHALSKQFGDEVAISGSLGVAIYPQDGTTFDELYQYADRALYQAKRLGRNCCVFYGREQAKEPAADDGQQARADTRRPVPKESGEQRHTLLVVDDQRINRVILREIFQDSYTVMEASNGREALEILRSTPQAISAMVLDLMMPEVDGLDVLRAMNEDAYYQSIPVIVVSAAAEDEYSVKAIELGAVDFVTKPINERLVRLRVRNAIFRREMENLRAQNRDLLVQRAEEARHQNQLRYLAEHDSLTHICNKSAFYRNTREMLEERAGTDFCIVSFDIQRFRAVNDIFGHEEGDRLLRYLAMQLQNVVGREGTYSRVDTDNFAFCIPYRHDRLMHCMQALMKSLQEYDLSFEVVLSFGIFLIDERELTVNQMYDRAEMAKRTVKDSYLHRWAFYDDTMREKLLEEQEIVSRMNGALEEGEFIVYYQPKCRLDTGMIVGAEALVRWQHKTRGLLSPAVFIPVFEKNGFIMKLDVYMWERVCAFLSQRLRADPTDPLRVSVNISRANLYNPNLCRTLDELCKKYGVPNERMEVEITESAYVENAHLLLGLTDELHRLGFTVEMDDFGSGYSSLNMLKEIPVDVLKLDMRFLYGIQNNERGGSILSSTVRMARQLRLQVIAEGVENEDQARFLASIGCELAQGYYYAPPMPQEMFERRLAEQPSIEDALTGGLCGAMEMLNRLLCSAVLCERKPDGLRLLKVNEYYLRMMRIQSESFDRVDEELSLWISGEDRRLLERAMQDAKDQGAAQECVYLQRDVSDRHHLLKAKVLYLGGGRELYMITFTDESEAVG